MTDERLCGEFPPQPAVRYGSVVFDFGDYRATEALTEIINQAANAAAVSVEGTTQDLSTTAGQQAAEAAAQTAASGATAPVVANADVGEAFETFLPDSFSGAVLDGIATNANPSTAAASARAAATNLQNRSFYRDSRAVSMVEAVVQAVQAAGSNNTKKKAAHGTASSFADVANDYQRFIAGQVFSDMIVSAASAAANAVMGAREESLRVKVARCGYRDTRAPDAVNTVLDAVIAEAVSFLPAGAGSRKTIRSEAEAAGRLALANQVPRVA